MFRLTPVLERKIALIVDTAPRRIRELHASLQQALNWDEEKMGYKWYGIACDYDSRHSWTYWPHRRSSRKTISRLDIARGKPGWMPIERCQLIPQAQRTQDSTESGIEMVISGVKRVGNAYLDNVPGVQRLTVQNLQDAAEKGAREGATKKQVQKCWEHMIKACTVFAGKEGETVKLVARGKTRLVYCVDGNWVPRPFNG